MCVKDKGPGAALWALTAKLSSKEEKAVWLEEARLAAILGSCPKSIERSKCGMRCWIAFARHFLGITGSVWPPTEEGLLAWSNLFRDSRTFSNYLGYLRTGCLVVRKPTEVLRCESIKRAKLAIDKRKQFKPREKQFVRRPLLVKLMQKALAVSDESMSMLFLAAYVFMLRVPSEGVKMRKGGKGLSHEDNQSVITLENDQVSLCGI